MNSPRILPVLDLMGGLVVRGLAGRRSEYRPIESVLAASPRPGEVAAALRQGFGFREAYVADLDALAGSEPDWESYRAIEAAGLKLWLDAGIGDLSRARRVLQMDPSGEVVARLIIGLESWSRPEVLPDLVALCGAERLVFSLDMKAGLPLAVATAWQALSPENIVVAVVDSGLTSIILLDLAQVGMYQGTGTEDLCRKLRQQHPHLELIGGGGVRSPDDLAHLATAGFDLVLVASALHDGRLTPADLVV